MIELVSSKRAEVERLCREFSVRRLDVFGSAADGSFDEATSDVDMLVEFDVAPGYDPDFDYAGLYFGLKDALERLFGREVDVVMANAIRNPYVRRQVMATRERLYAA